LLNIHSLASIFASAEESGLTLERLAPGLILFFLWHDAPLGLKPLIPIGKTHQMRTTHMHTRSFSCTALFQSIHCF